MWYDIVKEHIEAAEIKKCPHDDAFFYWNDETAIGGSMSIHVDDFMYCGSDTFRKILEDHVLDSFVVGSREEGKFTYLGLGINQDRETKDISVTQHEYIMSELKQI